MAWMTLIGTTPFTISSRRIAGAPEQPLAAQRWTVRCPHSNKSAASTWVEAEAFECRAKLPRGHPVNAEFISGTIKAFEGVRLSVEREVGSAQRLVLASAARARIHAGDVVTTINGRPLKSTHEFEQRILAMAPGTRIYLRVFRNRQLMRFTVPLGSTKCPQQP